MPGRELALELGRAPRCRPVSTSSRSLASMLPPIPRSRRTRPARTSSATRPARSGSSRPRAGTRARSRGWRPPSSSSVAKASSRSAICALSTHGSVPDPAAATTRRPDRTAAGRRCPRTPGQTRSGTSPRRISPENSAQPAQKEKTDSSVAKTTMIPSTSDGERAGTEGERDRARGGAERADALGEALRRAGHDGAARGGCRRTTSRSGRAAERGAGRHAGEEAECERVQEPQPAGREGEDRRKRDDRGHRAGGLVVHGIGELEQRAHGNRVTTSTRPSRSTYTHFPDSPVVQACSCFAAEVGSLRRQHEPGEGDR